MNEQKKVKYVEIAQTETKKRTKIRELNNMKNVR